jgi:hypothetical protein
VSNASMSARDTRHVFGPDSEPTEMEMRVAEAIKSVDDSKSNGGLGASYLRLARAAIRAMREPYPEMAEAAILTFVRENGGIEHAPYMTWRAMIDAASPGDET